MKMLTAGKVPAFFLLGLNDNHCKREGNKIPFINEEDLAEYVDFLRERGMDTAESAFHVQEKEGDSEYARKLFGKAFVDVQRAAGYANQIREELEPTTSILYRSAAHLAHNAGMEGEVKAAAEMCLAGKFAAEFKKELMPYIEGGE